VESFQGRINHQKLAHLSTTSEIVIIESARQPGRANTNINPVRLFALVAEVLGHSANITVSHISPFTRLVHNFES